LSAIAWNAFGGATCLLRVNGSNERFLSFLSGPGASYVNQVSKPWKPSCVVTRKDILKPVDTFPPATVLQLTYTCDRFNAVRIFMMFE